jgi:hypothetical protein
MAGPSIPPIAISGVGNVAAILAKLAAARVPLAPRPQPVTITAKRYFGQITALMTIEERGTDRLTLTRHPVASGVDITDHSYKEPAELTLRMMATNALSFNAAFPVAASYFAAGGASGVSYVEMVYQQLIQLQAGRQTFSIQTGKRLYDNMLLENMTLTTDQTSENALMLQMSCREIIVVSTTTIPYVPQANQAAPQKTDSVAQGGSKQASAAPAVVPILQQYDLLGPPLPSLA